MVERIDSKTPEQIRQALEYLAADCPESAKCKDCAYGYDCINEQLITVPKAVIDDALALIQRLEAERDAALAKVPRWISVEERLPTEQDAFGDGKVLCVLSDRMISLAGANKVYHLDTIKNHPTMFSYWMPLPEPPKEGE